MGMLETINSLAMIFILIIPGIIFKKLKLIDSHQTKGMSAMFTNLTLPALIIDSMQIDYSEEVFYESIYILFVIIGIFVLIYIISMIATKFLMMPKKESGLFTFMMMFANTGFIGIPVIQVLFGQIAVFYTSIIEMINDFLIFTVGAAIIQRSSGEKASINFKNFLSPGVFSIIFGYILFLTNYRLPGFLGSSIKILGSATTPLGMFVVGSQLGDISLRELFGDIKIYILCFAKLLVAPILAFIFVRCGLQDTSLLGNVIILSFAFPAAIITAIFAEEFDSDAKFATKGILLSTILCAITIPVIVFIL